MFEFFKKLKRRKKMASYKFKVGDIVKGTDPDKYGVTNSHMTRGRVTEIGEDGWLSVKVLEHDEQCWVGHDFYYLNPKYFDLVSSTEKPEFRVGQRVRIRSWEDMEKEFGKSPYGSISTDARFVDYMRPLCGRTATISSICGKAVDLKDWSDSSNTAWVFSTDMLEPADKFEVGQIYRVGKLIGSHRWEGAIIRLAGICPFGFTVKSIRGEAPFDFATNSEYARSLTLLTGPQIGEAIRKYDANHAEKKADEPSEYREVHRAAKVGERIKVIATNGLVCNDRKVGDIFLIDGKKERPDKDGFIWGSGLIPNMYVVLEGYSPVKEVKRRASAGEYVKVLDDRGGAVKPGTIWRVKSIADDGCLRFAGNGFDWMCSEGHYVVLEGYNPGSKHIYSPAEIAEAKKFVLDTISELAEKSIYILFDGVGHGNDNYTAYIVGKGSATEFDEGDLTISGVKTGESKCSPNDEPNEWVGKAVALCKALHKPLPSFVR